VAWASFVAALVFLRTFVLFSPNPVLRLTPFRRLTFALACLLNLVIGFGILRVGLFDSDLSRTRARLFQPRDRNQRVFVTGIFMTLSAAARRAADDACRSAHRHGLRLLVVCPRLMADGRKQLQSPGDIPPSAMSEGKQREAEGHDDALIDKRRQPARRAARSAS